LNPREVVLDQIHHRDAERVPYTVGFEGDVAARLDAHFGSPGWRDRLVPYVVNVGVVDTMRKLPTETDGTVRDPFGTTWRVDRRPFHLERPALASPTLEGYVWPEPEAFHYDAEGIRASQAACAEWKDRAFITAWLGWTLFETSWAMRGFDNVLIDIAADPDFHEELLDRICAQFVSYVEFTCAMLPDADAIYFGDDWGDQRGVIVGPERWRKLYKPRYAALYDLAHRHGKIVISHCCGSIADIMPDVIEIGLDVLESVQPEARGMNPYELKRLYGDKITFWGCLGSQSTIPFGTPESVRREVGRLAAEMGRGGGFILAPAKALQPETPTENAAALVEALLSLN
jgi:uroporphyrinogen decarboxylase